MTPAPDFTERPWPPLRDLILGMLSLHRPMTFHGMMEVDVTRIMDGLARLRRQDRQAVSMHAVMVEAVAVAAARNPGVLTFRHRKNLVTFRDADVATVVDRKQPDGTRLPMGLTIRAAQDRSVMAIHEELRAALKGDLTQTEEVKRRRRLLRLPKPLRALVLRRIAADPHLLRRVQGTIGLTSLQRPGLDFRMVPFPPNPFTLSIAIGGIDTRPAVAGGAPRRVLSLGGSMDHAVIDGAALARFTIALEQRLADAEGMAGLIEAAEAR
jgi:pyruvate/2-oxoglutarate dehydrogenase complex dihydrolipoamide acyltransferase (E2) component